jgi:hypothetical protein
VSEERVFHAISLSKTFPLLSLVCLRWGEKRRGEEKGRTKETNREKKGAKVEKVKKVDLEGGITTVTTPPSKTLPASTATRKTTTQCLAFSHSL